MQSLLTEISALLSEGPSQADEGPWKPRTTLNQAFDLDDVSRTRILHSHAYNAGKISGHPQRRRISSLQHDKLYKRGHHELQVVLG